MKRHINTFLTLVAVLLIAACDPGKGKLKVDNTEPVSADNRVIYQLNVGAFTPEGTFNAALQRLGYLDTLGADILWLMPIYPRGDMKHSPYASMDFNQVNPSYGTVDDVKAFVARAHELGMKVWLDWVPNHVANENPWVESHPDYFTTDKNGKMIHPMGWMDVLELNYKNPALVEEMNNSLKFWISEVGVDGFRCDYVSSPTIPVKYWQDIIQELKKMKGTEFMSETDITDPNNQRIDSCGFDYDYAWNFQGKLAYKFGGKGTVADSLKAICEKFLDDSKLIRNKRMVYLTNHDQNYNDGGHTLKDFYGDNRYALSVLEFTLYGMPLIYQGQEIGDPDTLNYFTDAKVKWNEVDKKMQNTVRTLIALHHSQPSLAADSPVEFLNTTHQSVLAYRRGPVVVVMNLGLESISAKVQGIESGRYRQWLNSETIADGISSAKVKLEEQTPIALAAKGFVVYVKE